MKEMFGNINHLLLGMPRGAVVTSSWLAAHGVSHRMQHHYANGPGLLARLVGGAYVVQSQQNDVHVEGAIYALESQLNLGVHIGAMTALSEIHHVRHFINLGAETKPQIFASPDTHFPAWFVKNFACDITKTQFLHSLSGIQSVDFRGFRLQASSLERAILEAIFLCKGDSGLKEIFQIMEMLTTLRPNVLQDLLENCSSVKVKRIFLHIADIQKHCWFDFLDLKKINLGAGKRVISPSGKFDPKYLLIINDISEI
jgi:hypothetical protein